MDAEIILQTPRLTARILDHGDGDALAAILANPRVMRYIESGATYTREQTIDLIRRHRRYAQSHAAGLWALVRRADDALIGWCGILSTMVADRPEIEFGYLLAEAAWGQGYATEIGRALVAYAEEKLDVKGLMAMTHPDNKASARVIEKCGLVYDTLLQLPKGPRLIFRRPGDPDHA